MKQLGAIDASFLYMETAQTPMHAGSLCILEPLAGGGSFHDAFRAHLARRLHLAPVLGRTLAPGPLDMDHPAWVDAGRVDLDHHVRRVSLPRPGSRRQLDDLVARLHSNPLDGDRPPWEFHVIEGLEGGRASLYAKLHHAVLDADAGVQLTEALFDAGAEPREVEPPPDALPPAPVTEPEPEPETPSFLSFLGDAQSNLLRQQMRALSMIPEAWQAWTRAMMPGSSSSEPVPQAAQEGSAAAPERPAAPRTPLNGTITSQRSFAALSVPLADAEAVAQAAGVRLDDVVLAACGAALRRWLLGRRALPKEPLVALVPLAPGDPAAQGIDAAAPALLVGLATDVADPLQRLHAIAGASRAGAAARDEGGAGTGGGSEAGGDRTGAGRASTGRAGAGASGSRTAEPAGATARAFSFVGASLLLQGALSGRGRPGRAEPAPLPANATICTMAGPAEPLHLAGARMVAVHPVSIPTHGLAVGIAAQCYGGDLDIGVTACRHVLPDAAQLAGHLLDGLAELKQAIAAARPAGVELASGAGAAAGDATRDTGFRHAAAAPSGEAPPSAAEAASSEAAGDRPGGDSADTAAHAEDTGPAGARRRAASAPPAAAPGVATSTGGAAEARGAAGVREEPTSPADAALPAAVAGRAAANDTVATVEEAAAADAAALEPAAAEAAAGATATSDRAADGDTAAAPGPSGPAASAPGGDGAGAPATPRPAAADDAGAATREPPDRPAPRARRGSSSATGKAGTASVAPVPIAADDAGAALPAPAAGAGRASGAARKSARGAKAKAGVPAPAARRRTGADTAGAAGTGDKAPATVASAAARDATKEVAVARPAEGDTPDPAPPRAAKPAAAKRSGRARTADAVVADGDEPAAKPPRRRAAPVAGKPGAAPAGDATSADADADAAATPKRRGNGATRKAGGEKASRSAGASTPRQAEAATAGSKPAADGPATAGSSGARKSARSAAGGRRSVAATRPGSSTSPPDDAGDKELAPARARRTRD